MAQSVGIQLLGNDVEAYPSASGLDFDRVRVFKKSDSFFYGPTWNSGQKNYGDL
nr:hypothetical protein [uncultured bacterium]